MKMLILSLMLLLMSTVGMADIAKNVDLDVGYATNHLKDGFSITDDVGVNYMLVKFNKTEGLNAFASLKTTSSALEYVNIDMEYIWKLTDEFSVGYGIRFDNDLYVNDGTVSQYITMNQSYGDWIILDLEYEYSPDYYVYQHVATKLKTKLHINLRRGVYVYVDAGILKFDKIHSFYYGGGAGYDFVKGFSVDVGIHLASVVKPSKNERVILTKLNYSFD